MTVVKVKVKWGTCSMFVDGLDMNCPLCGTLIKSGEKTHYCETPRPKAKSQRLKAGSA
jgi:uncharacterized C2H2 Zn-finger protein